jgi:high-affinity Fe2+/Pb2+ permease
MVDNRSAGFYGIGGGFNFKSGDISGTAARTSDDKQGPGTEYYAQGNQEEQEKEEQQYYVDRSAQLRASLNSLAAINAANIKIQEKEFKEIQEENRKKRSKKELVQAENEHEKTNSD